MQECCGAAKIGDCAVGAIPICLDFRYIEIYIEIMRNRHDHGFGRFHGDFGDRPARRFHSDHPDHDHEGPRGRGRHGRRGHGHGHHGEGRHGQGRGRGRLFDYGELRLLVLALIAESPRHGYELIKAIEERLGGAYTPSPGVIYPTLAWLEDSGYAAVQPEESGRKRYSITAEGEAFLSANRAAAEALLARTSEVEGGRPDLPAPVLRAMQNLKLALRLRLRQGPLDQAAAEAIAAALDGAAQTVEKT